jgi:uncharacterized membrane protein
MDRKRLSIIILATAGVLFAGYLTSQSLSGVCRLGCAYLWGLPTCVYGLVFFAAILASALLARRYPGTLHVTRWSAIVGVLFSLYYAVKELLPPNDPFGYWLGLPNCVYGLVFYIAIAVLAFWKATTPVNKKRKRRV